ncbi:PIG-L family deacetylase [Cellulomonas xiejunii]|uniref:PIG-L family deacetylase n=1 Tax=Cellulomonas xiejunii TaxID=2968083 RepID=A0ABY5KNI0_9CELL|nr:PIG-L family deacetylase [Cellulomonas xiejunii]MCC2321461.1 PIG-L family deacetylase [Cellulomonas xiejunii]MCC2323387.1 PIG-L family deacetylase [Cellulomonas xiejunii]UUI72034.1 PIG-L family deacetylase [Cellulomonas xiejunii]
MPDDRYRALVLEDDPDAAELLRIALEREGMVVVVATTAEGALSELSRSTFDVLVTDIQLPGRSGLEILPEARRLDPALTVMVVTAYPTFDHAVEALREAADEFLVKPVSSAEVVRRATELAKVARERRTSNRQRILAVGAHPDDVEIGAGATLAAHGAAGDDLVILTLSGGAVGGSTTVRQAEAAAAAAVVGARLIHLDFPDTHLVPAEGIITAIERTIEEVQPDRIYTHSAHDRHQDHRAVHEAVEIAARQVPNVWCFQSPSSTVAFAPNRFVDVAGFVDTKLQMLAAYESQAHRDYMRPDMVRATTRYWSRFSTSDDVEPLETVRASETVAWQVRAAPAVEWTPTPGDHGSGE